MSVLLTGPFGPSRPMDRPVSLAFRFFRMGRSPKRTSRPSSSMTGSIPLFKRRRAAPCSHELRERDGVLQIAGDEVAQAHTDRKSTRLNSSHLVISYAVFCLKKKLIRA